MKPITLILTLISVTCLTFAISSWSQIAALVFLGLVCGFGAIAQSDLGQK